MKKVIFFAVGVLTLVVLNVVHAQPTGPNVISGVASVTAGAGTTTVTAGNNSILRWNSFNVPVSETVQFIQPSRDSRVLNWIGGATASQIDGAIRANGQIYLMNLSGVYFGQSAVVDAGKLFAVGGSLSKEDFLAGFDRFTHLTGEVSNAGTLTATTVALIGRTVSNSGTIVSPDGFVALAAGQQIFLGKKGSKIYVDTGESKEPTPTTNTFSPGVSNSGKIDAGSGAIALAAGDIYSLAITQSGNLRGRNVRVQGKGAGDVVVSGSIDVTSSLAGKTGGYAEVTGARVNLTPTASITASGQVGGGTILIGGDTHGANAKVRNATTTIVEKGAFLSADALQQGPGGKIVVWSDGITFYAADLFARGAGSGGNGGFAEVSGKQLFFQGSANLDASFGHVGTLLLDPFNLTINNATDTNVTFTHDQIGNPVYFTNASPSTISWATIVAALVSADLTLQTSGTSTEVGNITVAASPATGTYNTVHSLTLSSGRAGGILVNQPVINAGTGDLILDAGTGGITFGGTIGSPIVQTGGTLSLLSGGAIGGPGILRGGVAVNVTSSGTVSISTDAPQIHVFTAPDVTIKNSHTQGVVVTVSSDYGDGGKLDVESRNAAGADDILEIDDSGSTLFSNLRMFGSNLLFSAGTLSPTQLTIGNSGTITLPTGWTATTLTFQNSGRVGSPTFSANVPTLVFNKTGGSVDLSDSFMLTDNSFQVTATGVSTNTTIRLQSGANASGNVIIGAGGLSAKIIEIDAGVSGPGTLVGTQELHIGANNAVGSASSPLVLQTPKLFLDSQSSDAFVVNKLDSGLDFEAGGKNLLVVSQNTAGSTSAPMSVDLNGVAAAQSISLTSSTLRLDGGMSAPTITLNHAAPVTVSGGGFTVVGNLINVVASTAVNLNGTGDVGSSALSVFLDSPRVNINASSGGVFLDNGSSNLGLNFISFSGAGAFKGGDVSILSAIPINVGANALSFASTRSLNLANLSITGGTLTFAHDGALLNTGSIFATTLVLGGAGSDGTTTAHFGTAVVNLQLRKTGTANVYVDNKRDAGLTLNGSLGGVASVTSLNAASTSSAPLAVDPTGLSASTGSIDLGSSTLALAGGLSASTVSLTHTGPVTVSSGSFTLSASTALNLSGAGDVGSALLPLLLNSPRANINASSGSIFLDNGASNLGLNFIGFSGGGAFKGGDLSILSNSAVNVGANPLNFTSTKSLNLANLSITAGALTLAHDGTLLNSGSIFATTLTLGGAGDDGASTPFSVSVPNLVFNKTGGNVSIVDNFTLPNNTVQVNASGSSPNSSIRLQVGANGTGVVVVAPGSLSAKILEIDAGLSGSGSLIASQQLTISASNSVGSAATPSSIRTPLLFLNSQSFDSYLVNTLDAGLTLEAGGRNLSIVSKNTLASAPAPLAVDLNGVSASGGSIDLNFSSLRLDGGLAAGTISLTHAGAVTVSGGGFTAVGKLITVSASSVLNLNGTGDVGTRLLPLSLNSPRANINSPSGGGIFLDNKTANLGLNFIGFSGGGTFKGGDLSIDSSGAVNVGSNALSFTSTKSLNLGSAGITAGTLSVTHDGALSFSGTLNATTLNLGGAGDDGISAAHLLTGVANLQLKKTGTGNVIVDNKLDAGVTVSGTTGAAVSVKSLNAAGTSSAGLTIGSAGLATNGTTATSPLILFAEGPAVAHDTQNPGGSVVVNSSTLTLTGGIDSATVTLGNSGLTTGTGLVTAGNTLTLENTGDVGTSSSLILVNTPYVIINKLSGAVYINNSGMPLTLTPTTFTGGGTFSSGSFTLLGSINIGTNSLKISTTGALALGANKIAAEALTLDNGGAVTGTGLVTANKLVLSNKGTVGTVPSPLLFSGPSASVVLINRTYDGVNIGYYGGNFTKNYPPGASSQIALNSHLTNSALNEEEQASTSESDAATTSKNSKRGGGAAFRTLSSKADLTSAAREQLQVLGIYSRSLTREERLSRERKEAVFRTVPEKEKPAASDFEVVDARIDPVALREVLRLAADTGLTDPTAPRLKQVAHSFAVTYTDFASTASSRDATSYRTWLQNRKEADATTVLEYVAALRTTIRQIEMLGLTHQEIEVSKSKIYGSILHDPLNVNADFLRTLTEGSSSASTATLSPRLNIDGLALR